jgi:hypothetical protein
LPRDGKRGELANLVQREHERAEIARADTADLGAADDEVVPAGSRACDRQLLWRAACVEGPRASFAAGSVTPGARKGWVLASRS